MKKKKKIDVSAPHPAMMASIGHAQFLFRDDYYPQHPITIAAEDVAVIREALILFAADDPTAIVERLSEAARRALGLLEP